MLCHDMLPDQTLTKEDRGIPGSSGERHESFLTEIPDEYLVMSINEPNLDLDDNTTGKCV